jgi:hypothetical protein
MSTLNVGDRVRAKCELVPVCEVTKVNVYKEYGGDPYVEVLRGMKKVIAPASWWERIPEPLKELVPIEVLEEAFDDLQEGGTIVVHVRTRLARWLRERGYGKAEG